MQTLPAELRDTIRALQTRAARDAEHIAQLQQRIDLLEEQFRLAQLKRFAPSSEKYGAQGCLFNEAELAAHASPDTGGEQDTNDQADETAAPGKKRGRRKLPAHLTRVRVEHDLADADKTCSCCHGALHRIGEDVTEQLHIVPAKVQVLQHVRFKYGCRHCEQHATSCKIVTSPMPVQPIPGSIASVSTVATVLTAKYADGIPLYRMEAVLSRSDIEIGRATMAHWVIRSSDLLSRLFDALRLMLRSQDMIHGDETPVQVLNGAIMTDGYAAWRMLEGITHLGCMAHARRRFDEALKAQKQPTGRAKQALEFIGKLYQIEKKARGKPPEGEALAQYTYRLRQEHSRPVLDAFYAWLVKNQAEVLPKSLIGKAIGYALSQWKYLIRYVDDGRAPVDNNLIERDIRPFTTGRNYPRFGIMYALQFRFPMFACRALASAALTTGRTLHKNRGFL
ncbi:IS66 family transposase, partial [Collimonas antrihumi]|uniref:IS66 family transposase n=1 Tax=Collimonas antrihumi TaxID=1940615 RepID=UPI003CCE91EB